MVKPGRWYGDKRTEIEWDSQHGEQKEYRAQ
ncbi:colicin E3/pyocin S6 family cytotoxin [Klebsiella pneumoniae]|nr:colicin E3/pyocin S6 family cytotoxin [Klebsiella pneumoniae]WBX45440.1 colicin E3/pyocin S6 family cytotoxin [Klebsiella pneumoniae]